MWRPALPLPLGGRVVGLNEGGGDEGGHHAAAVLAGMSQRVPLKTHAAPLPGRGRDPRRGGLDALVGVADHQLHAGQAPANEAARELDPEGFGFRGADRPAENLAPAVGVEANRARDRDADGGPSRRHRFKPDGSSPMASAALADLRTGGVDPEGGPCALDRPRRKGVDPLVDFLAEPADMALRDAGTAHGGHEVIHRARRDAGDIGLPGSRRSAPSRRTGAVRGPKENRSRSADGVSEARRRRPASAGPGRDGRRANRSADFSP